MRTLVKFGLLSDKARWDVEGYDYSWTNELDESDKDIIKSLRYISEGEMSGLGIPYLMQTLMDNSDIPKSLRGDFIQIAIFNNIIVYEEFRHGMVLSSLSNNKYIDGINDRDFGNEFYFSAPECKNWELYGLLMSLCISESTNVQLYSAIYKNITDPRFKLLLNKIQKDESRHLSTWKNLLKELVESDEYHMQKMVEQCEQGVSNHNAMLAKNFFLGLEDTKHYFGKSSLSSIIVNKHKILNYILGDRNPFSVKDLMICQEKFMNRGE